MNSFKKNIAADNKCAIYMKEYAQSRIAETRKVPSTVRLIKGIIKPKEIEKYLLGGDTGSTPVWEKAIGYYFNADMDDTWRGGPYTKLIHSLWNNNATDFVEIFTNEGRYFLDAGFVEYLSNEYTGELTESGYEMLDKFFLSKVALTKDLDTAFNFMQNILIGIVNGPFGYILKDTIRNIGNADNRYGNQVGEKENERVNEPILGLIGLYITFRYNEAILRGNYADDMIEPSYRLFQILKSFSTKVADASFDTENYVGMVFDLCGIQDSVFITSFRRLVNRAILWRGREWSSNAALNGNIVKNKFNDIEKLEKPLSLIEIFLNAKPIEFLQRKEKGINKYERRINEDNTDTTFMTALEGESLGLMKNNLMARDLMLITANINKGIKYLKESVGIKIMRTDAEIINRISRKIDLVSIEFECMSNQWNKMDAMNHAYDVVQEIDDYAAKTTNKDTMLALQSLRGQLLNIILEARGKDIKKLRTTINITYPKGYGYNI